MSQPPCFGRFRDKPTYYRHKYCVTCDRVRVCIYQAGIYNALVDGERIRSKPEEAPDCFAFYYDRNHSSNEPGCEDMCGYFTNCVRAALSAISFSYEIARAPERLAVSEPEQKKTQPKEPDELNQAASRFDNIELDGGENE